MIKNFIFYLIIIAGGALTGLVACLFAGLGLKWIVVGLLGLVLALAFSTSNDKRRFALAFFIFTIPFFVAKKIFSSAFPLVTGGPSALGLFLYDIPLIILMAGMITSKVLKRESSFNIPAVIKPFTLYIMWCTFSIISSSEPTLAFIEFVWLCKMALILLVLVNVIENRSDVVLVLTILLIGLFIQEVITFLQAYLKMWFTFTGDIERTTLKVPGEANIFRAGGTIGPHNVQSAYYVLIVPLATAIYFVAKQLWLKVLLAMVILGGILSVILTYSRNGYLSLFVAMTVILFLALKKRLIPMRSLFLGTLVFLGFSTLLILVKGQNFVERIQSSAAIAPRIESMRIARNMIEEHPFIGVGLNNFSVVMKDRKYSPEGISSLQQTYFGGHFFGTVVHNKYLLVASETGLIGLLFYCGFLLCSYRSSFKIYQLDDRFYSAIGAGIFAALSGAGIQMMSDIYNSDILITIFTVLIGLLFAINKIEHKAISCSH